MALVTDLTIGFFEKSFKNRKHHSTRYRRWLAYAGLAFVTLAIGFIVVSKSAVTTKRAIVVASKPTAEQYILGEIISQMIEKHTDIPVKRMLGIGGGTSNIQPALLSGEIDIYPEYTGTAWLFVLKKAQIRNPDSLYSALKTAYTEKYGLTWACRFGFNNTFTLALPEVIASRENIKTFSDLASRSNQFAFGAEFDFYERDDGFNGLSAIYPFSFKNKVELDVNLKFQALENHTVDVINAFSTDSRIRQMKLRVLRDDKSFFPAYQAGIVVRNEILLHYPELVGLLNRLEGTIDDDKMLELNYEVEIAKKTPEEVAASFLKANNLLN